MTDDQKDIVRKHYKAGNGLREIGRTIGFSHVAVKKLVDKEQLERESYVIDDRMGLHDEIAELKEKNKRLEDEVTKKLPIWGTRFDTLEMAEKVKQQMLDSGINKNSIRGVANILMAVQAIVEAEG